MQSVHWHAGLVEYMNAKNVGSVKNRFSDPTKVQIGQDQYRNDVKSDCWEKDLEEGCCKREGVQMGVFHREDKHQKELN